MNPETGVPDFDRLLEDGRPDFVELGQWCPGEGMGWLAPLYRGQDVPSLICDWTQHFFSSETAPAPPLSWKGRSVSQANRNVVRISW